MPKSKPQEASTPSSQDAEYRGPNRRKDVVSDASYTGLERRRGPGRRRSDFIKSAEEGEMTGEQFLFIQAMDVYKRVNNSPYPSWTEVLEVIRKLGYRKTCDSILTLSNCEDWTEKSDAPVFGQGLRKKAS